MIAQTGTPATHIRAQSMATRAATTAAQAMPAAWGLAVVEAAVGYEWLLSGLNKVLSADFGPGLARTLQSSLQGNPNTWYASLTSSLVLPHARLCAVLVEAGELLVAAGMFAGAALWVSGRLATSRPARALNLGVIAALIGGILMSFNYAAMAGDTLPWINSAHPFNEGLSIDSLLTIVGAGLLAAHAVASRRASAVAAVAERRSIGAA